MDDDDDDNLGSRSPGPKRKRRGGHRGYYVVSRSIDNCMFMYKNPVAGAALPADAPDKFKWPVFGDYAGAELLVDACLAFDLVGVRRLLSRYPQFVSGLEGWLSTQSALRPPGVLERRVMKTIKRAGARRLVVELLTLDDGAKVPALCLYEGDRRVIERRRAPSLNKVTSEG